jgi:hypothetical protein
VKPGDLRSEDIVFLDLVGTLVAAGDGGRFSAIAQSEPWLMSDNRRGVLCNLGPRRDARDILRILEDAGLDAHFESDLLIAASNLPHPLPDRRAFAVAAALAEVRPPPAPVCAPRRSPRRKPQPSRPGRPPRSFSRERKNLARPWPQTRSTKTLGRRSSSRDAWSR